MKKCNKAILPISIIAFSFALISINSAFSMYANLDSASDIAINITSVSKKRFLYWNGSETPIQLTNSSDELFSSTINVTSAGTYSYKITDESGTTLSEKDSIELALIGDFDLTYDGANNASSLTYSFSLEDNENAFGTDLYCFPSTASFTATEWLIYGSFCDWSLESSVQMFSNPESSSDKAMARHVYLEKGDIFKIRNTLSSNTSYYGWQHLQGLKSDSDKCFSENDSNDNINVDATGYYDFYLTTDHKIYASHSNDSDYVQGTTNGTETTFTLDASKYASSTKYLSFYGAENNRKSSENALATTLFSSSTKSTCSITNDTCIFLNPGVWNTASAWFLAEISDGVSTERYELVSSGNTDLYRANISMPSFTSVTFYRMAANSKQTSDYLDISITIPYGDTGYWNSASCSSLEKKYVFDITDWSSCSTTGISIYSLTTSN